MKHSLLKKCFYVLLTGLVIAGCGTNQTSDRLDRFLISEAKAYGGRIPTRQDEAKLVGEWTFTRDQFGTVIQCSGVTFQAIDKFFRSSYGTPKQVGKNAEGRMQWAIAARVAGVSFWYSEFKGGVQITILKPDSKWPKACHSPWRFV
jgi:hypothetical protein